ncbi:MAG: tetratricopeptide repeat protein [Leptospiraceae bacterium]|jgi:hypothetical protein|nr:tetratricopeptide repeat protein [Leptospiraceae bacterium]MCZ8345688.1 tetratricopeptide repeat protein [Leptospiraceae bacterium]PJE00385.1 MAG: hypothetical protein CK427_14155 [Leptospira sp.]
MYKNTIFFSSLLLFSASLWANDPITKVKSILDKERPQKAMSLAKHYLEKGLKLNELGKYQDAIQDLQISLGISEGLGLGHSEETAKTHLAMVSSFMNLSSVCTGKKHFMQAAKIYQFMDRKIIPSKDYTLKWESCTNTSSNTELSNLTLSNP